MDFKDTPHGSIDFSPAAWIKSSSFAIDDSELQNASWRQYERFWRVYYSERKLYSPNFKEFTLVLRPGYDVNTRSVVLTGINRFMHFFTNYIFPVNSKIGIKIYQDNCTELIGDTCYELEDAPKLLFEVQEPAT